MRKIVFSFCLVMALAGCSASATEPKEPQTTATKKAEPTPTSGANAQALLFTETELSPSAIALGEPGLDRLEMNFFGDLIENNGCVTSVELLTRLSETPLVASTSFRIDQENPAGFSQFVFDVGSDASANGLVEEFKNGFLSAACLSTLGKDSYETQDLNDAIKVGSTGQVWIDTNTLVGDEYMQVRALVSNGSLVLVNYALGVDYPDSKFTTSDSSSQSGAAMKKFLAGE